MCTTKKSQWTLWKKKTKKLRNSQGDFDISSNTDEICFLFLRIEMGTHISFNIYINLNLKVNVFQSAIIV